MKLSQIKSAVAVKRTSNTVLLFILLTAVFFLSAFNFEEFSGYGGGHWYYASEALCPEPESTICTLERTPIERFFRGSPTEPLQIQTEADSARYVSSSFSQFLKLFLSDSLSLRENILIVQLVKSVLSSALLMASLILMVRNPGSRQTGVKILLTAFSLPYLVFGNASFYPAPIAIVASIPFLLSLRALRRSQSLTSSNTLVAFATFMLSLLVILANRFEVSAFAGLALLLSFIGRPKTEHAPGQKSQQIVLVASFLFTYVLFCSINLPLRRWTISILSGSSQVLSADQVANSKAFTAFGDAGLAAIGPLTFFDNTSRNNARLIGDRFIENSPDLLQIVRRFIFGATQITSWYPLIVVLLITGIGLAHRVRTSRGTRAGFRSWGPGAVALVVLAALPGVARAPLFFWYVASLLFVIVFAVDYNLEWESRILMSATCVAFATNLTSVWMANEANGNLHISGLVFTPTQLSIATSAAMTGAGVCVFVMFRRTSTKSNN
jgi:hypothetical protein